MIVYIVEVADINYHIFQQFSSQFSTSARPVEFTVKNLLLVYDGIAGPLRGLSYEAVFDCSELSQYFASNIKNTITFATYQKNHHEDTTCSPDHARLSPTITDQSDRP